jgi:hypothetical protein
MRMSRLIIHGHAALAAAANDRLDRFDRPVEQVHFLAANREPAAARDPRPPAADLRDLRGGGLVHEAPYDISQALNVEPGGLVKVKADVIVRGRMRCANRSRAAQRDGDDTGNRGESG